MTKKIRVAVLYGGRSLEHDISLISAANVITNLDRTRFDVIPIGIDKKGAWYLGDDILKKELATPKLQLNSDTQRLLFHPDLLGKDFQPANHPVIKNSERIFDVVFPVIHGVMCEDGTVQGLLELADIPYVGCGVLASSVGMDKDVSKRLVQNAGVATPDFYAFSEKTWLRNPKAQLERINRQLSYPMFVKPANTGSSVGVFKIKDANNLENAIRQAFKYDTKVIVEQGIDAIELEVAVLESFDENPVVSLVGEVKSNHEFYSYEAKYLDENGADLIIPAPLDDSLTQKVKEIAKNIFHALNCEGMARVDLFLDKKTQQIYFNEINTIPGFTEISMYPKLMKASGISYPELLSRLIDLALEKHQRKNKLHMELSSEVLVNS